MDSSVIKKYGSSGNESQFQLVLGWYESEGEGRQSSGEELPQSNTGDCWVGKNGNPKIVTETNSCDNIRSNNRRTLKSCRRIFSAVEFQLECPLECAVFCLTQKHTLVF